MTLEPRHGCPRIRRLPGWVVTAALAMFISTPASAGTLFALSWSFEQYSAEGTLVLSDAVGSGQPFDVDDVESFQLELFDGAGSVGTGSFPPWPGFDVVAGTRTPSGSSDLTIADLVVSEPFGIIFGCDGSKCLTGTVFFESAPNDRVDFGSQQAALAAFVFTEVPEPAAALQLLAALAALARLARHR